MVIIATIRRTIITTIIMPEGLGANIPTIAQYITNIARIANAVQVTEVSL